MVALWDFCVQYQTWLIRRENSYSAVWGRVPQSQVLSQISGATSFPGGTPVLVGGLAQFQVGGTPVLDGAPQSWPGRRGYSSPRGVCQSWPGGTPGLEYPHPAQDWATPPPGTGELPPSQPGQQSDYLLCHRQYACCGHAGGLSGFLFVFHSKSLYSVFLDKIGTCSIRKKKSLHIFPLVLTLVSILASYKDFLFQISSDNLVRH